MIYLANFCSLWILDTLIPRPPRHFLLFKFREQARATSTTSKFSNERSVFLCDVTQNLNLFEYIQKVRWCIEQKPTVLLSFAAFRMIPSRAEKNEEPTTAHQHPVSFLELRSSSYVASCAANLVVERYYVVGHRRILVLGGRSFRPSLSLSLSLSA